MNFRLLDFHLEEGMDMTRTDTHFEQVPIEIAQAVLHVERERRLQPETSQPATEQNGIQTRNDRKGYRMDSIDVFRTEPDGNVLWRGTASSLEEATARVRELAKTTPGEYLAVNLKSGEKVKIETGE